MAALLSSRLPSGPVTARCSTRPSRVSVDDLAFGFGLQVANSKLPSLSLQLCACLDWDRVPDSSVSNQQVAPRQSDALQTSLVAGNA